MSFAAEKRYLDRLNDRLKINVLYADAAILPKRHRTFRSFKSSFGNVNYYETQIAGCYIVIDIRYAYRHFMNNTYYEDRANINGTLLPTLNDPILVIKDYYNHEDILTFYKPFKSRNELYHIVMFKAYKKENGKYYFKTIYRIDSNLNKVKRLIKALDQNTLYFKYAEGSGS